MPRDDGPRFRHVLAALVRHLHDFAREVELTDEEWRAGVDFLTAAGQACDERRQEIILLSDVLGLSMLVDEIAHRARAGATESSVLGPFYVPGAREIANGADLAAGWPGEPLDVSGTVKDTEGRPVPAATLEIWQAGDDGFYDTQLPSYPEKQLRAVLRPDEQGAFRFRTIRPRSYPVPTDGPVGALLAHMGRHPYRPAHIHFIVAAPGFERLVTQLFVAGDAYLESDAVFGVKRSLVIELQGGEGGWTAGYDFVLQPSGRVPGTPWDTQVAARFEP